MRPTGFWFVWLVFVTGVSDVRTLMHLIGKLSICCGQRGGIFVYLCLKRSAGSCLHDVLLLLDTCEAEESCNGGNFNPQVLRSA